MSNNTETPINNGVVFTILQIIKAVLSLAAKAKVGALYINCQEAVPAQNVLEFMGHKQPPTTMQTNNTTALGLVNSLTNTICLPVGTKNYRSVEFLGRNSTFFHVFETQHNAQPPPPW